jgi:predicted O-methyltransferase YrrM
MAYNYTYDWVTIHEKTWTNFLSPYIGVPNLQFLEVGSYEGRSTVWFLENILTHETAKITCIDQHFRENFYLNMAKFSDKISIISDNSQVALRADKFLHANFDVIYIDGSHIARHVLEDAILALPSLKVGGIMIFDDYWWEEPSRTEKNNQLTEEQISRLEPKIAIDSFVNVFGDSLEVVYKQYQVICKKVAER